MKRFRRIGLLAVIAATAMYFLPVLTLFYFACGAIDISRHKKISYELVEKYFMSNGILTWMLSPLNLLADLFSFRNIGTYRLEDLPAGHRNEIETCVSAFRQNGDLIKGRIAETLGKSKRGMLTFRWFNAPQVTELKIPEFEREYRYIKTIAVSVFNTRERTSWHFGPLRLTFRVLCNHDPIDSRDVYSRSTTRFIAGSTSHSSFSTTRSFIARSMMSIRSDIACSWTSFVPTIGNRRSMARSTSRLSYRAR